MQSLTVGLIPKEGNNMDKKIKYEPKPQAPITIDKGNGETYKPKKKTNGGNKNGNKKG